MESWGTIFLILGFLLLNLGLAMFISGNSQFLAMGRPVDGGPPELRGQGCTAMIIFVLGTIFLIVGGIILGNFRHG